MIRLLAHSLKRLKALMADIDSSVQVELDKNKWAFDDYRKRRRQIADEIVKLENCAVVR